MNREPTALSEDVTIIEQKMSSLERENFDLKMRLFYKEKESLKDHSTLENEAERVVGLLQTRDDTYDQLRRANEEAYNTISELRAELQLVKASKEGSNSAYEGLLHKNQRLASLQLEENLKRERQASQAIAAHDASVIAKLEDDIAALEATHEADNKLVSECAGRVAELMGIVEEKNATIEKQATALDAANEHIEVLTDRISRQEIFLIRGEQQNLLPKADSSDNPLSIENKSVNGQAPPPPPRRNPSAHSLSSAHNSSAHSANMSNARMLPLGPSPNRRSDFTSSSRHQPQLHHHQGHGVGEDEDEDEGVGSSMSLRPAPRLGQPFMSSSSAPPSHNYHHHGNHSNQPQSQSQNNLSFTPAGHSSSTTHADSISSSFQHFSLSDLSSTVGTTAHPHATAMAHTHSGHSFFPRSPAPVPPSSSSGHSSSPFPHSMKSPSSAPNATSAANHFDMPPRGYLSEEAKKLINAELEIEVLKEENFSLKQNLKEEKIALRKLEETLSSVRSSSEEITLLEAEEIARLEAEIDRISEERDKFMTSSRSFEMQLELMVQRQRDRGGSSVNAELGTGVREGGGYTPSALSTPSPNSGGDNIHRESLHHSGEFHQSMQKHAKSRAKDSALFDMYRRREVELLDALEGVVKKCHSLEEELKEMKRKA